MNGLVKAAQPFAGMDLLWESGRRAGQVFLSTPQSAVWVTEGLLVLPFVFQAEDLPGWIWPQLGDCLHLVWAVSAAWVWGCGAWLQQCRGGCQREGKGSSSRGSASPSLPGVCGFAGAGFMRAALLSPRAVGFGKRGAVGRVRWGQWLLLAQTVGWA